MRRKEWGIWVDSWRKFLLEIEFLTSHEACHVPRTERPRTKTLREQLSAGDQACRHSLLWGSWDLFSSTRHKPVSDINDQRLLMPNRSHMYINYGKPEIFLSLMGFLACQRCYFTLLPQTCLNICTLYCTSLFCALLWTSVWAHFWWMSKKKKKSRQSNIIESVAADLKYLMGGADMCFVLKNKTAPFPPQGTKSTELWKDSRLQARMRFNSIYWSSMQASRIS